MAYKRPKVKENVPYIFLIRKKFKNLSNKEAIERRIYLRDKVKNNTNTGDEFDEYLDLSHLLYYPNMHKSKSFREAVYAGEI